MSNIKNEAIDNNISSKKSEISNNNSDNSQITHKSKEIKNVKKVYRYNYLSYQDVIAIRNEIAPLIEATDEQYYTIHFDYLMCFVEIRPLFWLKLQH